MRWPDTPLDERASVAVGGLLTALTSSAIGVVAVPAALFLLRDYLGRRTVIWGSLASACVAGVLALGPAWQWWKAIGSLADLRDPLSLDPAALTAVLPFVAAAAVLVLCLVAMNRGASEPVVDETTVDQDVYRPFGTTDLLVILATLAYLLVIQGYWFFRY